jgi:ParB/RepB/Spo0J family partition protein
MTETPDIRLGDADLACAYLTACENGIEFDALAYAKRNGRRADSVRRSLKRLDEDGLIRRDAAIEDRVSKALITHLSRAHEDALALARAAFKDEIGGQAHGGGALEPVLLSRLHESDLNPRKHFDPEAIKQLALDILDNGLLQNPVGRPHPGLGKGHIELAAGASRLRAMLYLAEHNLSSPKFDPARPVSVLVRPMTDADMLLIGIAENRQRTNVHPLEEGEAFLRLQQLRKTEHGEDPQAERLAGKVTDELADAMGKSRRWVQERTKLARDLAPAVRDAFRQGRISIVQARAFASHPDLARQESVLANILTWGAERYGEKAILRELLADGWVYHAEANGILFDLDQYQGGKIELDAEEAQAAGYGDEPVIILEDAAQAKALQRKALDAKAEALKAVRAFVVTTDEAFTAYQHDPAPEDMPDAETGAVLVFNAYSGAVTLHDRRLKLKPAKSETAKAETKDAIRQSAEAEGLKSAPEPYQRRHWLDSKRVKSGALRQAVAGNSAVAMTLALLGSLTWFGGEQRSITLHPVPLRGEDHAIGKGRALFDALRKLSDKGEAISGLEAKETKEGCTDVIVTSAGRAFASLIASKDLPRLFAAAIADQVGSWAGTYGDDPSSGDSPLVLAIVNHLGEDAVADALPEPGLEYFERFNRGSLTRIAQAMGKDPADMPDKAKEAAGWLHLRAEGYQPPEWRFASREALTEAADALMSGKSAD